MEAKYKNYVCINLKDYFPQTLSHNRFVGVMQSAIVPLTVYLMKFRCGKCSGVSFLDATSMLVAYFFLPKKPSLRFDKTFFATD